MKLQNKWFIGAMLGAAVCLVSTSCVDEIKFGNSFWIRHRAEMLLLTQCSIVRNIRANFEYLLQ